MTHLKYILTSGLIQNNPFFLLIGICPAVVVTTSAIGGLMMGLSTLLVLLFSNFFISLLRKLIPSWARIPCYVLIIASLANAFDLLLQAFFPTLSVNLGVYLPLTIVNCLIFARAEMFASKNGPLESIADGLGIGLGFTCILTLLGMMREILGNGSVFGIELFGKHFSLLIFMMPAGAFFCLGFLIAIIQKIASCRFGNTQGGNQ